MRFAGYQEKASGNKFGGLAAVVVFHVALIFALLHGLGHRIPVGPPPPPDFKFVPEPVQPQPPEAAQSPQIRKIEQNFPTIVLPELHIEQHVDSGITTQAPPEGDATHADKDSIAGAGSSGQGQVTAQPLRLPAVVDARNCEKPAYPLGALRAGDTGTVTLAFLVGTDGKVLDSRVERSSGSRVLDNAARAGLALCKFIPGTVDGRPEQFWTKLQYVWKLD